MFCDKLMQQFLILASLVQRGERIGMGGIGKTTLAKKVASQAKQDNLFDEIIFVEVSKTPDI